MLLNSLYLKWFPKFSHPGIMTIIEEGVLKTLGRASSSSHQAFSLFKIEVRVLCSFCILEPEWMKKQHC
jgi:hypothetical protein